MTRLILAALLASAAPCITRVHAQIPRPQLEALAASLATRLAAACPRAPVGDVAAHAACTRALRAASDLPFAPSLAWGGDQPAQPIKKKQLTVLQGDIYRSLYLSLFWFDGTWSVAHDDRDDTDLIRIGAFFRNDLPPGEFPYPFWHSSDKWSSYETTNQINFYIDSDALAFAITRSTGGNEAARGTPLVHHVPPAFDGNWQWTDGEGHTEPTASLFSNKYRPANPYLQPLDAAYRDLAMGLREGTCLRCHTPANRAGMNRLVLLQTPAHAAAEIDDVLEAVRDGDMPKNDFGAKRALDPQIRDTLLTSGEQFSKLLAQADAWEAQTK